MRTMRFQYPSSLFLRSTLVCLCLGAPIPSSAEEYHSETYGYRLEIPKDWVEIPEDVLEEAVAKEDPVGDLTFDTGFQRGPEEEEIYYPYVIVQVIPYSQLGLNRQLREDEFAEVVTDLRNEIDKKRQEQDPVRSILRLPGVGHVVQMGPPTLESVNRRFVWPSQMEVPGVGVVHGLGVGTFGRSAIVQVLFFSRRAEWRKHEVVANSILESFRFDPASAYRDDLTAEPAANETSSGNGLTIAFFVAVLAAAVGLLGLGVAQNRTRRG